MRRLAAGWREPGESRFAVGILALTHRCQCSCAHCGVKREDGERRPELGRREIVALLDDFAALGVRCADFFGGEPLLDPRLADYVRYAKRKGMKVVADTNGLLLDERMAAGLKRAGLDGLFVSLDSPRAEEHDRLRGVAGLFDRVVAAARHCVRHGLDCALSICASRESLASGDAARVVALGRELGVRVRLCTPICAGRLARQDGARLSSRELAAFRGLLDGDKVFWELEPVPGRRGVYRCGAAEEMFYVSPYGDVQPCCYCGVVFGNVREEPLGRILRRMSRSHMAGRFEGEDCPMNTPGFRRRHAAALRSGRYDSRSDVEADAREWDAAA
ncbi:MAG: radical SAM protein, partial [Elusimicrobia bacterium]|nr:radical SAM protein [Elusimicrobiota bacterium]